MAAKLIKFEKKKCLIFNLVIIKGSSRGRWKLYATNYAENNFKWAKSPKW